MKLIRPFVSGVVACGLLLGMVSSLSAQEQGMAKVVGIKGSARYMTSDNQTWRPLRTGTVLRDGAIVQTASDSWVDLVLNNPNAGRAASLGLSGISAASTVTPVATSSSATPGSQQDAVRIFESTVLGIDKLSVMSTGADRVTQTQLDLKAGRILGTVKPLSAASQYEVKIPNGVAGIRGTTYLLSADGVLSVLSGSVTISYVGTDGSPVVRQVQAGYQYDAKSGQLTRMSETEIARLQQIANALGGGDQTAATEITIDKTVYFVSPTIGETDGGYDGGWEYTLAR